MDLSAIEQKLSAVAEEVEAKLAAMAGSPELRASVDGAMSMGAGAMAKLISAQLPDLVRPLVDPVIAGCLAHLEQDVDKWMAEHSSPSKED